MVGGGLASPLVKAGARLSGVSPNSALSSAGPGRCSKSERRVLRRRDRREALHRWRRMRLRPQRRGGCPGPNGPRAARRNVRILRGARRRPLSPSRRPGGGSRRAGRRGPAVVPRRWPARRTPPSQRRVPAVGCEREVGSCASVHLIGAAEQVHETGAPSQRALRRARICSACSSWPRSNNTLSAISPSSPSGGS